MRATLFSLAAASLCYSSDFNADPLEVCDKMITIISTFENTDYLTIFTDLGEIVYEMPFRSKIISWKREGEQIYIFSRDRQGLGYYLSCLNFISKKIAWERTIYPPSTIEITSETP